MIISANIGNKAHFYGSAVFRVLLSHGIAKEEKSNKKHKDAEIGGGEDVGMILLLLFPPRLRVSCSIFHFAESLGLKKST